MKEPCLGEDHKLLIVMVSVKLDFAKQDSLFASQTLWLWLTCPVIKHGTKSHVITTTATTTIVKYQYFQMYWLFACQIKCCCMDTSCLDMYIIDINTQWGMFELVTSLVNDVVRTRSVYQILHFIFPPCWTLTCYTSELLFLSSSRTTFYPDNKTHHWKS